MLFSFYPSIPRVAATVPGQIFLPFVTRWTYPQSPLGTSTCQCNQVYSSSNFVGYGPGSGLPGGYGLIDLQEVNYANFFQPFPGAYGFGLADIPQSWYLGAFGHFSTTGNSFGFLTLFDATTDIHYETPFRIESHTHLSVWYVHSLYTASKYTMIDALMYNQATGQFAMLGDYGNIVDQYGVRLNAAYRGNDPVGSWYHAVFDMDPLYNTSPGNWFVMRIFVRFDNSLAGSAGLGDATTFFGDVRWTYGISAAAIKPVFSDSQRQGPAYHLTTIEAWSWNPNQYQQNLDDLLFKVSNMGWSDATHTWTDSLGGTHTETMYPYQFGVSSPVSLVFPQQISAKTPAYVAPTGVNLTTETSTHGQEYVLDAADLILEYGITYAIPATGPFLLAAHLAYDYYQLTNVPSGGNSYTWPFVDYNVMRWNSPTALTNDGEGVSFMQTDPSNGIQPSTGISATISSSLTLAFYDPSCGCQGNPSITSDLALSLSLSWSAATHSPSPAPSSSPSLTLGSPNPSSIEMIPSYCSSTTATFTFPVTSGANSVSQVYFLVQGQPSYLQISYSPNPLTATSSGTSVTTTLTIPAGGRIYSTITYNVQFTSLGGGAISNTASLSLTVDQDCYGSRCVCSHFTLSLQPSAVSVGSTTGGTIDSNLTITWAKGEQTLPVTISIKAPNQLQGYFSYRVAKSAQPADNMAIYQLVLDINPGAPSGVYPLGITVQEIGNLDQVQKTILFQLTITS